MAQGIGRRLGAVGVPGLGENIADMGGYSIAQTNMQYPLLFCDACGAGNRGASALWLALGARAPLSRPV